MLGLEEPVEEESELVTTIKRAILLMKVSKVTGKGVAYSTVH